MTDRLGVYRAALEHISPEDRTDWLHVGMALHHECGGSEEGFETWSSWSQPSKKYNSREQKSTWRSFKAGGGVTGATIIRMAKAGGYRNGHVAQNFPAPVLNNTVTGTSTRKSMTWDAAVSSLLKRGHCLVAAYSYRNEHGVEIGQHVRFEPKTFRWRHELDQVWMSGWPGGPIPPYALPRMLEHVDEAVFDAEGEKDADHVNELGGVCVSTYQGHEEHAARFLRGRTVYILPDNDQAGRTRAETKLKAYRAAGIAASLITLPGLQEKGDISDWFDRGHNFGDLIRLTEERVQDETDELLSCFTPLMNIAFDRDGEEYLVDEILPAQGIGILYGPTGLGKTFVALDMALSVARGVPFAGEYEVEQGATVYVALEAPSGVKKRLAAYKREHGVNDADFYLMDYPIELGDSQSVNGLSDRLGALQRAKGGKIRLVVIDTLAKAMPGRDDNSSKDMSVTINHLEQIQRKTGGCIMVVAHPGKDEGRGIRGSSALSAAVDFILRVRKLVGSLRELSIEKMKDGEADNVVATFVVDPRPLGTTQKGRDVTSAIITWIEATRRKTAGRKPSPMQAIILSELDQLLLTTAPVAVVSEEELMNAYFTKQGLDPSTKRTKAQKDIFGSQIRRCERNGFVGRRDGTIWKINRSS